MDTNMRYRPQAPPAASDLYCLSPDQRCINYDVQNVYGDELHHQGAVILELKSTRGHAPVWMMELIRRFELKQVGFSKYLQSSLVDNQDNGWWYMDQSQNAAAWSCDRGKPRSQKG